MVDSVGSPLSYNELFNITNNTTDTKNTVDNTVTTDREDLKEKILDAASESKLSQTLRARFDVFERQVAEYESDINRYAVKDEALGDVQQSLAKITELRTKALEENDAEKKAEMQEELDKELAIIKDVYEKDEDGNSTLRAGTNMQKILDEGISLEGDENAFALQMAQDEVDLEKDDVSNRMNVAERGLERVNERYDEALSGAQAITGTQDANALLDDIRFSVLKNVGAQNISNYYTINASSVLGLLD